jgi:hypothetical protein
MIKILITITGCLIVLDIFSALIEISFLKGKGNWMVVKGVLLRSAP